MRMGCLRVDYHPAGATERERGGRVASPAPAWRPSASPWLIAISVMLATFMEVLDTSVANVSLPHIAGSLAASKLPPENATGNYVKVVQRVPVKIVFDELPRDPTLLGPGMSVVPTVKVR
jgi:hypothetical protein